jgi:ABC-type multidrug transport system ATPase subunit
VVQKKGGFFMIQVKDLTKAYGERLAIDHLNFQVEKGEVVGFLGRMERVNLQQ